MSPRAEFGFWQRRVEYLDAESFLLKQDGAADEAAIFEKSIPQAIEQRERWRRIVLSGK